MSIALKDSAHIDLDNRIYFGLVQDACRRTHAANERRGLYCSRSVYGLRASTMLYPLPNTNTFDVRQMIRSRSTMVRMRSRNRGHCALWPALIPEFEIPGYWQYRRLSIGRSRTDGAFAGCQGDHKPIIAREMLCTSRYLLECKCMSRQNENPAKSAASHLMRRRIVRWLSACFRVPSSRSKGFDIRAWTH